MKLKNLHIRIEEELYNEFIKVTDEKAINRSALIRKWVEEYLSEDWRECTYCGTKVPHKKTPGKDDDEGWQLIAWDHRPGCEWVESRAHQID